PDVFGSDVLDSVPQAPSSIAAARTTSPDNQREKTDGKNRCTSFIKTAPGTGEPKRLASQPRDY
ncbi:MAG: hypothetical protein ABJK18_21650, partial [Marinobacter sp.]